MTLIHMVLFKFRAGVSEEQKTKFIQELKTLKNLPSVKNGRLIVGSPSVTDPIERSKGFQIALVSYHEDLAALAEYQASEEHHRVTSTYFIPYREDLVRFDFEVDAEDEYMCQFPGFPGCDRKARLSTGSSPSGPSLLYKPLHVSKNRKTLIIQFRIDVAGISIGPFPRNPRWTRRGGHGTEPPANAASDGKSAYATTVKLPELKLNSRQCDGNIPSCGSCLKAGVACINDGKQEVHRSYIANIENRIKWLESIVRDRCSDVDLDHGLPRPQETLDETMQTETLNDSRDDDAQVYHQPSQDAVQERRENQPEVSPRIIISGNQEVLRAPSRAAGVNEESQQAHEIGLVSLSPGGDRRYIGPSSGYFFAQRILKSAGCRGAPRTSSITASSDSNRLSLELLNTPAAMPAQKQSTVELSTKYFRTVHLLYPFLHEQTHMEAINRVYASHDNDPLDTFQVYMVLAIASLNLSRQCKVHLPVEGYYASAMKHLDHVCNLGSVTSLQCLLLLMVYALYNPSCNINIWNLNYQCLASVIDLGLQRDVRASESLHISVFDQEMRTRIFWVVYTFDRTVCTMMGRPIGIRDEACDIRFPLAISDRDLTRISPDCQTYDQSSSHISSSIHLFKLAQLNSEIKYIMHSINREAPAYALPVIRDILTWQQGMVQSLDNWNAAIPPQTGGGSTEIVHLCRAKYHETMILLLRPSPGIPNPSDAILDECFNHALALLREFSELYATGNLLYNRLVVHSIFLGTLVMLNCIWKLPATAARVPVDELISKFNTTQNILSSIGEHWFEATRARDCIKELSTVTIQRLLKTQVTGAAVAAQPSLPQPFTPLSQQYALGRTQGEGEVTSQPGNHGDFPVAPVHLAAPDAEMHTSFDQSGSASEFSNLFDDFLQGDFPGWSGMSDIDGLMWEIFNSTAQ
ncbi:uncharacterized protein DSM5745_07126 [Aspergillus mulundensis]|uniref:Stress-response A/B barrel domain-containing protein n=1 Tax=Aspergillus mulundensis TaxID=1810919 RepID=A0A3D8RKN4_9EURO|nr:Uncharacterized protein DSM5745_07126 [Aspergillus mulundensis]RDW74464.1 Uncharacterized protein DSM5745_07126 [Aspergillus mulundensis]